MKWKTSQNRKGSSSLAYALTALALSSLLLQSSPVQAFGGNHKKVRLRDVQTLTFQKGRMTTGRRTSPVPQTSCVGGNACGDYEPDVIQCKNTGFDGGDVQWKCQADLPDNLKFGKLDVYCEGFDYPDDPYVLKGSCGLEYKLYYTDMRYDQRSQWGGPQSTYRAKSQSWADTIFRWAWIGVVGLLFSLYCFQRPVDGDAPPPYRAPGGGSGGHGGGGGGGWGGGGDGGGWGNNNNNRDKFQDGSAAGFRPGFWSGLGLGGLATYLATNNQNQNRRRDRAYASTSDFFSGWGAPSAHDYSDSYAGPSGTSSASSSRPTRTATGFGETRRR
ncbi:hypothetical protein KVV02_002046 [Mortierella alpina]|uniref:Store-operated calcium entry-associated regulatory factor n=1 Tax=Mortierella alpina TaxID=64518 RepID=A0A9P8CZ50_MORAP|nr:hypothetical protein KVV02_002046 [Mortierella alpina]